MKRVKSQSSPEVLTVIFSIWVGRRTVPRADLVVPRFAVHVHEQHLGADGQVLDGAEMAGVVVARHHQIVGGKGAGIPPRRDLQAGIAPLLHHRQRQPDGWDGDIADVIVAVNKGDGHTVRFFLGGFFGGGRRRFALAGQDGLGLLKGLFQLVQHGIRRLLGAGIVPLVVAEETRSPQQRQHAQRNKEGAQLTFHPCRFPS